MTHDATARPRCSVDLHGRTTYYEVAGAGTPVVWLHAPSCSIGARDEVVGSLAQDHRVYVPFCSAPFSHEAQATHTIAFIEALGLGSVRLAGWSDGAIVGLLVAMRRPGLVSHLVFVDQFKKLNETGLDIADLANLRPPTLVVTAEGAPQVVAQLCREFFAA